jgi:hypothetical protein
VGDGHTLHHLQFRLYAPEAGFSDHQRHPFNVQTASGSTSGAASAVRGKCAWSGRPRADIRSAFWHGAGVGDHKQDILALAILGAPATFGTTFPTLMFAVVRRSCRQLLSRTRSELPTSAPEGRQMIYLAHTQCTPDRLRLSATLNRPEAIWSFNSSVLEGDRATHHQAGSRKLVQRSSSLAPPQ